MAPAREALARGLGIIDALKALNLFDHGTLAILAGSERANRLVEGIPHAIHSITQKRKNARAIMGTMGWLAFDVFSIVSSLWAGKDMVLKWFTDNPPTEPVEKEIHCCRLALGHDMGRPDLVFGRPGRFHGLVRVLVLGQPRQKGLAYCAYCTPNPLNWRLSPRPGLRGLDVSRRPYVTRNGAD
jgi:hypothetical protein